MNLKSFLSVLILMSSSHAALTYEELREMGSRYVTCLRNVGNPETPFPSEELKGLLGEKCSKIENCHSIATTLLEIEAQLQRAIASVGQPWVIDPVVSFADANAQTCILQFKAMTDKMKPHTTMIVLKVDSSQRKIIEINEVFALVSTKEILA